MGHKIVYNSCYGGYGLSDEAVKMLLHRGYHYDKYEMCEAVPRHNKDLVEVVETLGAAANTEYSDLQIYELPEGCNQYRITEYDGKESVEIPDYVDWITIE